MSKSSVKSLGTSYYINGNSRLNQNESRNKNKSVIIVPLPITILPISEQLQTVRPRPPCAVPGREVSFVRSRPWISTLGPVSLSLCELKLYPTIIRKGVGGRGSHALPCVMDVGGTRLPLAETNGMPMGVLAIAT
ncbi:hypothetical protein J6590_008929 [Homalodisca vitripennis]|nr:hypothetical protein J6590_008929 [Homalodisca vitripennis]